VTQTAHEPQPAVAAAGEHHLTPEQVRFFDDNGYLILRNRIPADVVQRLRDAADAWIGAADGLPEDDPRLEDHRFANRPSGRVLFRVDYLHGKQQAASLELLGCPEMLGIAESLAGPNFVPTYESMVFKNTGDGAPIPWHQDAVHPRNWRIFNVDVYLDPSLSGEGALWVLPRSHKAPYDLCRLEGHEWNVPESVEVEMGPGDVLLHDTMVVHGSPPVLGNRLRRTLYYEFRAAEQILAEGPWDRDWVDARMRLVPLALAEAARSRPDVPGFEWRAEPWLRPESSGDTETELRVVHTVHSPSAHCSAGSVVSRPDERPATPAT